jgi:hypothetical protein
MNNRQANGRRRGRGGQQQRQGGNPNQGNGNRIDNRARGNAAQLLEKYKNLARDAQMQGDRVNTEYYLQFADHYFRVLSETRSRFEEQNQQRRPRDDMDGDDEDFEFEAEGNRVDGNRGDGDYREERQQREPRQDRDDRQPRQDREERQAREPRQDREERQPREPRRDRDERRNGRANGNGYANGNGPEAETQGGEAPAPQAEGAEGEDRGARRRGRPRRDAAPVESEVSQGIDAAVLPPAFGDVTAANDAEEAPKKPRRRRVAKGDEAEVPPAA